MAQREEWEREYVRKALVSGASSASQDVKNFARFLRKKEGIDFEGAVVLDLGSGVGKNSEYFAREGAVVTGYETARNALREARKRARETGISISYEEQDIGRPYPVKDGSVDIVLDNMSSNSLSESERETYLVEVGRALKPGGYFFARGLSKEGDQHAQALLKKHPAGEKDTYIMPGLNVRERVFAEKDLDALYGSRFAIMQKFLKYNYTRFEGKIFKRRYWVLYLEKR